MEFSSIPLYIDPSNTWNQQQQQQPNNSILPSSSMSLTATHHQGHQVPTVFPVPRPNPTNMSAGTSLVRPGSMADRARLANIPQPEQGLKCPRCESTNTKFCYFNNYSLSQPRHFCKSCRRYWTRGGAMRNVPVGGGYRRNKRKKSSSSKSTTDISSAPSNAATGGAVGSNIQPQAQHPQLPFMSSLNPLAHGELNASNLGLGFSGVHQPVDNNSAHEHQYVNQLGSSCSTVVGSSTLDNYQHRQWRLQQITQQFPNFLSGGGGGDRRLYSFDHASDGNFASQGIPKV